MTEAPATVDRSHAWEKEYAPKVTLGMVVATGVLFAIWIAILAYIAIDRWSGSLQ